MYEISKNELITLFNNKVNIINDYVNNITVLLNKRLSNNTNPDDNNLIKKYKELINKANKDKDIITDVINRNDYDELLRLYEDNYNGFID